MSLCFVIFYVHVFLFCKSEWFIGLDAKIMREKKRKYRILIFWASLVGEENEEHSCENSSETLASMVGLEIFPTCSSEGGARMIFGWEIDWLQLFFFFFFWRKVMACFGRWKMNGNVRFSCVLCVWFSVFIWFFLGCAILCS